MGVMGRKILLKVFLPICSLTDCHLNRYLNRELTNNLPFDTSKPSTRGD